MSTEIRNILQKSIFVRFPNFSHSYGRPILKITRP